MPDRETPLLAGVDVGGTTLRAGLVRGLDVIAERRVTARLSEVGRGRTPAQAAAALVAAVADLLDALPVADAAPAAIGIGVAGYVDAASGRLVSSPNLPGLADVDLAGPLGRRYRVPVGVDNDGLVAAWGEHLLAGGAASLVRVGLGTGVGGGIVAAGRPWRGDRGMAMEIGHLIVRPGGRRCGCGQAGCLERYASATGVVQSFRERAAADLPDGLDAGFVADRARAGDRDAIAAFELAGESLATGLAHLVKLFDVRDIVIGGGLSAAWPLLRGAFDGRLAASLMPVFRDGLRVRVSTAGDRAGIIGAAHLAADLRD